MLGKSSTRMRRAGPSASVTAIPTKDVPTANSERPGAHRADCTLRDMLRVFISHICKTAGLPLDFLCPQEPPWA
jgi:hypothetical protein